MHHRKILKTSKTEETSDDQELTRKRKCLPFMRSSKPAKRCPSPNVTEPQESCKDPFSHLLVPHTDSPDSNQPINPHSDAYRKLGSLSGQRVSRHDPSSSIDTVINQSSKITVLPSWEKLVSKKRGGKKKQQKRNAGGAWRTVDEHVAQLKRKAACLDRSVVTDDKNSKQYIKDENAESTKSCDSRWNFIPVCGTKNYSLCKEKKLDIKSISSEPQLATVSMKSKVNSSLVNKPMDSEAPAWKPAPVVGKTLDTNADDIPTFSQNWLDKLDQDTQNGITESSSNRQIQSTQSTCTSDSSPVNLQSSSSFKLVLQRVTELSFQRVPGSEHPDMSRLTSPWPNIWSPSPPTDKFHEE